MSSSPCGVIAPLRVYTTRLPCCRNDSSSRRMFGTTRPAILPFQYAAISGYRAPIRLSGSMVPSLPCMSTTSSAVASESRRKSVPIRSNGHSGSCSLGEPAHGAVPSGYSAGTSIR